MINDSYNTGSPKAPQTTECYWPKQSGRICVAEGTAAPVFIEIHCSRRAEGIPGVLKTWS